MSWLDIFRKAVPKVGELETGKSANIRRAKKNSYICECVISFDGNPVRRVKFEISAYSRSHAEDQIKGHLKINLARTYRRTGK